MNSPNELSKNITNIPFAIATPLLIREKNEAPCFSNGITSSSSPKVAQQISNFHPSPSPTAGRLVFHEKSKELKEDQILELMDHGYTRGMISCLEQTKKDIALRIWVVDNSGSMLQNDGYQIMEHNNRTKLVPCSRWTELCHTVNHQIELARIIGTPTSFRLLNNPGARAGPQTFDICCEGYENHKQEEAQRANDIMSKTSPMGATPLTARVNEIYREIKSNEAYLRNSGKRVSIIIATDGFPTDSFGDNKMHAHENFINALRQLEGLPIWILIRLCTNDENVVAFYNNLDKQLELSIEVLDDYVSEAKEIHGVNPWLNYGLPLHRLREIGANIRILDFLDEHRFTLSEVQDFIRLLFGNTNMKGSPDPNFEFSKYSTFIKSDILSKEKQSWNPMKKKLKPWINIKQLNLIYKKSFSKYLLSPRFWSKKGSIADCQ